MVGNRQIVRRQGGGGGRTDRHDMKGRAVPDAGQFTRQDQPAARGKDRCDDRSIALQQQRRLGRQGLVILGVSNDGNRL